MEKRGEGGADSGMRRREGADGGGGTGHRDSVGLSR